ncbi:MAG TPA: hypothetical protein VK212_01330 [Lentimicrobium sp.]|nr:hypothetical protein [Lentimicrobium sp.]
MKRLFSTAGFLFLLVASGMFTSCEDRTYEERTYMANVPVVMGFNEFRSAVVKKAPQTLVNPGKIYFKDNFIFINEIEQGIHVIDNTNPASPVILNFINIPGNVDMAVKGNILYADSYIDLVAIDISDPANPVEVDRIENAFPNVLPPMEDYSYPVYGLDFNKGVVIGWETRMVTEVVEKENQSGFGKVMYDDLGVPTLGGSEVRFSENSAGVGGSMAGFTISDNFLYALHNNALKMFNIGATPGMTTGGELYMEAMVETLFPYENKLYMGTQTGMLIYDISNPGSPTYISNFQHIKSCDPVVIEGGYAYVTLRTGTVCNGENSLLVVDVSSPANPFLVKSYPMFNPHGLGIDNKILFVCDGDAGLKIYDATDPQEIITNQIAHFSDIKTYDVIPVDGLLMLIGADGLYQYDYSDLDSLRLISSIPVGN